MAVGIVMERLDADGARSRLAGSCAATGVDAIDCGINGWELAGCGAVAAGPAGPMTWELTTTGPGKADVGGMGIPGGRTNMPRPGGRGARPGGIGAVRTGAAGGIGSPAKKM
ncbi:MAG: hypothetical protein EOO65_04710 [Methanosarcinales archaeon]|nr:MAG: hypothetical protein EOO65_04710 [Methanosarcinales archaeon]